MGFIVKLLVMAVSALGGAYLLPGVSFKGFASALIFAALLGASNAIVKPVLLFVTLPINILTLGLFTFVINALIILLINALMDSFTVDGFLNALLFSILLSVISAVLEFVLGL